MDSWTPAFVYFPHVFFSQEELAVASQLRKVGAEAIPHLLPLLHDENRAARNLAYYTLAEIEGWTEEHLDALMESHRGGDDWIPLAIAKIGTPRAASFLVEQLVRRRERLTQLSAAVPRSGENAVPPLLRVYQTETNWDSELEEIMYHAFDGLNGDAAAAIEPLVKIADNEDEPDAKRFRAVKALGAIGPAALLQFLTTGNRFLAAVPAAEHAGDPYTTMRLMCDITELRERGTSAGPLALKLLSSKDWDVRVEAARTLGRIGYQESAGDLVNLLQRPDDWRLVFSAAESLAMLKNEEAISGLTELSERHWYLPVREVALEALKAIRTGIAKKPAETLGAFDFFDDRVADEIEFLADTEAEKLQLPTLAAQPEVEVTIRADDGTVRAEKLAGIEVEDGYLVGIDNGEWGGKTAFVDRDANSHVLTQENTQTIYKTVDGIFAVTGVAHMGTNRGFIFKIQKGADQQWRAEKWRALPGAPRFSRLLENGSLFVSCDGIVVVSPGGEMKSMTRSECLQVRSR